MLNRKFSSLLAVIFLLEVSVATSPETKDISDNQLKGELEKIFEAEDQYEAEGRFFNFDRGSAFNTSVAFTIPLFSFTLPGAQDSVDAGDLEGNVVGVLSFISLFLLGGLGIAIYTTSQGPNEDSVFEERKIASRYIDNRILNLVYDSISGLPEAIDVQNCLKLSICDAHAQPERYGLLGLPFRVLFPFNDEKVEKDLTENEKAAKYGMENQDECYYEFPCLVQPLDFIILLKDSLFSSR